jgi:hypothetical protein
VRFFDLTLEKQSEEMMTMETRDMFRDRPTHPWVEEYRNPVGFALQAGQSHLKREW